MLSCKAFYESLIGSGLSFFAGVPDSLLKDFGAYVTDHTSPVDHIIAANEGNAIGLAAGHYLATGSPGLVYMQNSGLGNAVNPLVSLTAHEVFGIPILLLIGWRGEPGKVDAPQHVLQGKVTLPILETLGIEHRVLPSTMDEALTCLNAALGVMRKNCSPYALVVRKGTFEPYHLQTHTVTHYLLMREESIKIIADRLGPRDVVVSTTGKTSRELFDYRVSSKSECMGQDFYMLGSMGHASQIALGIALAQPDRQVLCMDGDGALIMHMGVLPVIGTKHLSNFKHIVFNNGAHDSVGGQPTAAHDIDIPEIAKACGYSLAMRAVTRDQLVTQLDELRSAQGPALLEIRISRGARTALGRPTVSPSVIKDNFMTFLSG